MADFELGSSEGGDFSDEVDADGVPGLGDEVVLQQAVRNLHWAARLKSGVQDSDSLNNIFIYLFPKVHFKLNYNSDRHFLNRS